MLPKPELDAIELVEKDFSMLFILALFLVIFVFLGFMKIRWLEAAIEEESAESARPDEPAVRIEFSRGEAGPAVQIAGRRFLLDSLDAATVRDLGQETAGRKVEIVLDPEMETRHWFGLVYSMTRQAKSVEFSAQ